MINKTLLFERLMENVTETVFFKDLESRFIAINKSGAHKFGLENPADVIGKTDFDFFAIIHAQKAMEDEHQILLTQKPIVNIEEREVFNDENRSVKWTSTSKFPLFDETGVLIGTYGITKDITEQKQHFEAISQLKVQVESILNAVPSMIFVKDEVGKYVMANQAAKDFFNPVDGEIIGKSDIDLGFPAETAQRYLKTDRLVIETKKPAFYSDEKTLNRDGMEQWHQSIKVPFSTSEDHTQAVLSVVTDVTQRIEYEVELTDSLNVISKQNERLSNFAHIVSHNLRNHAGGISMLISLLEKSDNYVEKKELFELLSKASSRLNETIVDLNDIIDTQNKVEVDLKSIDFKDTFIGIKEVLRTEIYKNKVVIEEDIEEGLKLNYSPAYLESILLNLLSNAIKYRSRKRDPVIIVKAWKNDERILLLIKDNGRGIDLEKYGNKLFGMYKTFHNNENAKGIGLYITKNQIEALGGNIKVESKPDEGATFYVDFGKHQKNRILVPV